MNISEQYIEIQAFIEIGKYYENGDFYCDDKTIIVVGSNTENPIREEGDIWLPRQDQLQNMIEDKNLIVSFSSFCMYGYSHMMFELEGKKYGYCNHVAFKSFDQLWLEFVMIRNFKKTWDFETKEWINI
jgi:hypothetical protein